jgi:DNA mismatch endonuclease, patch repair protein
LSGLRKNSAKKRTDVMTPAQRSRCMAQIKGRDTKPELILRRSLWCLGLRYRLRSNIEGRPDLIFSSARVAVFVDGCQWHCCPKHWVRPKSNTKFWDRKFTNNRNRDKTVNQLLKAKGWSVLRFWEHEIQEDCKSVALRISKIVVPPIGVDS